MNQKIRSNPGKGFTLIELALSLFILTLIAVSSAFVLISTRQLSEGSRGKLLASNAAHSALETIKNTALASVSGINTSSFIPASLPSGAMTITTNPVDVTGQQIATVTVAVTWRGPKNRLETLEVTTMRSRF